MCACVCLSLAAFLHYCTDPDVRLTLQKDRGCPLVVYYWADLQPVRGFRRHGNIYVRIQQHYRPTLQRRVDRSVHVYAYGRTNGRKDDTEARLAITKLAGGGKIAFNAKC